VEGINMLLLAPPEMYTTPPLAYPHPVITEILYAVPTKPGDANRDGKRDVAGDEFVELINPHDRVINLHGYSLRDSGEGKGRFKFTFPEVVVQPGQVVVVFNGNDARFSGPVGDAKAAPAEGHPSFHGALVFDAKMSSSRASWANKSDYVLLCAPNGSPLECVHWGGEKKPPPGTVVSEEAPAITRGSVQRARIAPAAPMDATPAPAIEPAPAPTKPPPKPAPRKDGKPTYERKYEKPLPNIKPAGSGERDREPVALTFGPFESHPEVPIFLAGLVPDAAEGDDGILFSPGLYPLDAAIQKKPEPVQPGTAVPAQESQPSGTKPGDGRKTKPAPARNTGDPR